MDIVYSFEYLEEVVKNDISQILQNIRNIIKRAIEERLGVDPFSFGKPLRYSWKGHKSLRVGDYRIKLLQYSKLISVPRKNFHFIFLGLKQVFHHQRMTIWIRNLI